MTVVSWIIAALPQLLIFLAVVIRVWFRWSGRRDMRDLFLHLRWERINHLDDGTVINHRNLVEPAFK